uniref:Uncharacterized protein n=1 Tax=viral metagenome TaxID=1070528 RepID=A0A6M3X525_9ZZZZ
MKEYNHDLPYHDYKAFTDADNATAYTVGDDNVDAHGSQRKRFVSKSTLLIATGATTVRFNHSRNVLMTLIANVPYTFFSNVHTLIIGTIAAQATLYAYFEGVLPEDAGVPE